MAGFLRQQIINMVDRVHILLNQLKVLQILLELFNMTI